MFNMRYRILITINQIIIRNTILRPLYSICDTDNLGTLRPISFIATTNSKYSTTWIVFN